MSMKRAFAAPVYEVLLNDAVKCDVMKNDTVKCDVMKLHSSTRISHFILKKISINCFTLVFIDTIIMTLN